METLLILLGIGLPSIFAALAIFGAIWLFLGRSRPVLAGVACFALGLLPLIWLRFQGQLNLRDEWVILPLATYGWPMVFGTISLLVGLVKGFRNPLPFLKEATKGVIEGSQR